MSCVCVCVCGVIENFTRTIARNSHVRLLGYYFTIGSLSLIRQYTMSFNEFYYIDIYRVRISLCIRKCVYSIIGTLKLVVFITIKTNSFNRNYHRELHAEFQNSNANL